MEDRASSAAEMRFQQLIGSLGVGVIVFDPDTQVVLSNPAAFDLLGLTQDQLLGKTSFDPQWRVIHEDGSPFLPETFPVSAAVQTLQAVHDVVMGVYRPAYADWAWLLVNADPELNADGSVAQVIVTFTGITALKQAEASLRESEARNRFQAALIENIHDAVISMDMSRRVLTWNQGAERMYGWSAAEAVGKSVDQMTGLKIADVNVEEIQHRLATEGHWDGELVQSTRAGKAMLVRTSISVLPADDGTSAGLLSINRDITEFRRVAHQKAEITVKEQAIKTLRRFLTDVSHDLRTPLSVMTTSLYLLRRKLGDDHPETRHLDMLDEQVDHMMHIVEDVAEITRLDDESVLFEFTPVHLNGLVEDVAGGQQGALDSKNLTLRLELAPELPSMQVDQSWLGRAIKNLISNAITYTAEGGLIIVRTRRADREVMIEIADDGIGIDKEHLPHIFERFYRVDDARPAHKGGVGLGLPIVRRIIEAHGGRVDVESIPGAGSIFRVVLPLS